MIIKNHIKRIISFVVLSFLLIQTAVFSQNVTHTYASGDTQYSIKSNFSITVDNSHQLDLVLEDAADATYLTLSQNGSGYNVTLISRDSEMSHHINIIGSIKDSEGNIVTSYNNTFTVQQETPSSEDSTASWMSGKWGVRFTVQGGSKLDAVVAAGANYNNGVKQIADTLKTVGYVISNLTNNAHGYHYTLRNHPYIDIANEIHPDFVPSLENEQIIIDALQAFKDSGKKVILYIASDGPSASGGTPNNAEYKAAWQAYYNENFDGQEGPAWRNLCQGFVERFNDLGLVDGFWVDHATSLPGGVTNFVNMLKAVNPNFAITVNYGKRYFQNEDLSYRYVSSNGIGMSANHKVVNLWPTGGAYNDFTAGHPTPLATGAAPNSWGYEELTLEETKDVPWVSFDNKMMLRHFWTPMRQNWTSTNSIYPVLFDTEQAYRFVRSLTDAGGAHSWANTVTSGAITQEEFEMFKTIDERMQQSQKPDYEAYVRPIGAYFNDEYRFTGAFNTNYWSHDSNWSSGQVPTSTSDVIIQAGDSVLVALDASVRDVLIEEGGSLSVSNQIDFQILGKVRGTINYLESIPAPSEPGIVSQYLFENNLNDEISDNHGTSVGNPTFNNSVVKEGNYSLLLDGTDDQINLVDHINDFPKEGSARTIMGWFNTTSSTGTLFTYGTEATGERFQIIGNLSELSVAVNGHKWGNSSLSLSSDWHHFTVVLPSMQAPQTDDLLLYIDGQLITSSTLAGNPKDLITGDTFAIIGVGFNGYLDDFRIYNTALDVSEINKIFTGPVLVSSLSFDDNTIEVFENNTIQMELSVLPENADNQSVTWSVLDGTGSATIDENGILTGVNIGTVTVTATSNDGTNISTQTEVIVSELNPVTSISVQGIGGIMAVELGAELQMEAFVLPENASIKEVIWEVEPEGGDGTIDSNGVFIGSNDGTVYIHAKAADNSGVEGLVSITVVTKPLVKSISVFGSNGVNAVQLGHTLQMQSSILPVDANDPSIVWSVADGTGSATINATGLLTGQTLGTITVTATATDGSAVYGQKEITVQEDAVNTDVTIYTTADAYVWDRWPTNNYGTVRLIVRDDPSDLNRVSFVKFDISRLSSINNAKFRITLEGSIPSSTRNYEAFLVTNDSWTEDGITWSNAPNSEVSFGVTTNNGQIIEWDVTSTVLSQMSDDDVLSIKIVSTDSEITNNIYSKEVALTDADKPQLICTNSSSSSLVTSIAVSGVNGTSSVDVGATLQMEALVLPNSANDSSVTWSVINNTGSATIDSSGLITGVTTGTVTVKAIANDGSGVFGQKEITVQDEAINTPETIYTIADAYVWDRFPTLNYGEEKLLVRDDPSDLNRHSFVKFDLNSLSNVNTAKFRLTLFTDPGTTRNYEAFLVTNDNWTENGINWNNAPVSGTSLGTATNNGQIIEWDVTDVVLSEIDDNGILSIMVVSKDVSITNTIYSKEAALIDVDKPRIITNEMTLSTDNNHVDVNNIVVYPNPTTSYVYINGLDNTQTFVSVYNNVGQLLQQETYKSSINLSALKPGIYYVKILNQQEQKIHKIIKK
ncbi:DNRLRE domain-containing protein [Polaribacter vadi]|uniref:CBM96 family carbohydrate-binding protein n=1 Tax=Polaribacter TaxID=52959 RepID=UPI001C09657E|nr:MULTISPECIES: DNRLRE domain-containing protein [Polaribacter]MBU3012078.1 DNRLRE domain-containing protein [Polaribacter vadi]MDO6741893.1 DNRLRE domain-containing protein [Polaribacter sp. 1_MG-2023]